MASRSGDAVTLVMSEGRRMMRLAHELEHETFQALLDKYHRLLRKLFDTAGADDVRVSGDTVTAGFVTARQAALAAAAAQRAVAAHEWPHGRSQAISVGLHTAASAVASEVCSDLCDAAEGGQIFVSPASADLLAGEDLGDLTLVDRGEVTTRRTQRALRAYELVERTT